jgi:uncharacterized protein YtpQ (UPF0354 family)
VIVYAETMTFQKQPERKKPEFIFPRMYVALPDSGSADITLSNDDWPAETRLGADVRVWYAYDMDSHFEIISHLGLKDLGMSAEELHQLAIYNLDSLNLEIRAHQNGPFHMLTAGGNFEATLLLLPHVWEFVASMVHGRVVSVIPARDLIFYTGEADVEGLSEMRKQTSRMLEMADKPLSRQFFVRVGDEWELYTGHAD